MIVAGQVVAVILFLLARNDTTTALAWKPLWKDLQTQILNIQNDIDEKLKAHEDFRSYLSGSPSTIFPTFAASVVKAVRITNDTTGVIFSTEKFYAGRHHGKDDELVYRDWVAAVVLKGVVDNKDTKLTVEVLNVFPGYITKSLEYFLNTKTSETQGGDIGLSDEKWVYGEFQDNTEDLDKIKNKISAKNKLQELQSIAYYQLNRGTATTFKERHCILAGKSENAEKNFCCSAKILSTGEIKYSVFLETESAVNNAQERIGSNDIRKMEMKGKLQCTDRFDFNKKIRDELKALPAFKPIRHTLDSLNDISEYAVWIHQIPNSSITAIKFSTVLIKDRIQHFPTTGIVIPDWVAVVLFKHDENEDLEVVLHVHSFHYGSLAESISWFRNGSSRYRPKETEAPAGWNYGNPIAWGNSERSQRLGQIKKKITGLENPNVADFRIVAFFTWPGSESERVYDSYYICKIESNLYSVQIIETEIEVSDPISLNLALMIMNHEIENLVHSPPVTWSDKEPSDDAKQKLNDAVRQHLVLQNFGRQKDDIKLLAKAYGAIEKLSSLEESVFTAVKYDWSNREFKPSVFNVVLMKVEGAAGYLVMHMGDFQYDDRVENLDVDFSQYKFVFWRQMNRMSIQSDMQTNVLTNLKKRLAEESSMAKFPAGILAEINKKKKLQTMKIGLILLYEKNVVTVEYPQLPDREKIIDISIQIFEAIAPECADHKGWTFYFATISKNRAKENFHIIVSRTIEALLTNDLLNYHVHASMDQKNVDWVQNSVPKILFADKTQLPEFAKSFDEGPYQLIHRDVLAFQRILADVNPGNVQEITRYNMDKNFSCGTRYEDGKVVDGFIVLHLYQKIAPKQNLIDVKYCSVPMIKRFVRGLGKVSPFFPTLEWALDFVDLQQRDLVLELPVVERDKHVLVGNSSSTNAYSKSNPLKRESGTTKIKSETSFNARHTMVQI